MTTPIRKQLVRAGAGPSEARELSHWQAAAKRFTFADRLDEAAVTLHPVTPAKVTMALLGAALASLILPWTICGLWVAGALGLEMWGWFASRPHAGAGAAAGRRRGLFAASYLAINGWWVVLAILLWTSGLPSGQALGASMVSALAAVSLLLFYNAPAVFLAAGAAPAIAALGVIALNDGRDLRQMLPVWLGLGLCAVFCGGRALETPSTQESQRRINASLREFEILAENVTDVITRTNLYGIREYVSPGCLAMLGFRPDELVGTRQGEFHHPDDKPAIQASIARLMADPTQPDPVRVRQAIFNLVGNALKFTARGHVIVRLVLGPAGDGRRYVRLEVEDTGVGMSPKAQSHLFERFRQAEGDSVRRFRGTGLGLSITQALVRMMGGEITFRSVEGEGSTFQMVFDAPAAEAVMAPPVEAGVLEGVNILLVEDNPTNRLMARTLLARLGANVEEAEDGLLGLEAARGGAYDLILMDIQMPLMDGVEATRAIRGLPTEASRVPIIALTANVMVHQRAEYLAAGTNGVVGKPISPAQLLSEIARVVAEGDDAEVRAAAEAG